MLKSFIQINKLINNIYITQDSQRRYRVNTILFSSRRFEDFKDVVKKIGIANTYKLALIWPSLSLFVHLSIFIRNLKARNENQTSENFD